MSGDVLAPVLERLRGVAKSGAGYRALCPAHDDTSPSLSVTEAEDGRVLLHCFKGCTLRGVLDALDLETRDLFPKPVSGERGVTEYHVRDDSGRKRAVHHRVDRGEKKVVWWETPEGEKGLGTLKTHNIPLWGSEAIGALPDNVPVVVAEGEKAAHALTRAGIPAVGTVTGASGTPSRHVLTVLGGRRVVLWPDNDKEGRSHMQRIGKQLLELEAEVSWFEWEDAPEKGDAADHPDLYALKAEGQLYAAPPYTVPRDPKNDGAAPSFEHALNDYFELIRLRTETGGITGIRTGIPKIDRGIHGLNKGYLYVIAARPNVGKSLLIGQIALTAAMANHRVLLQSAEMDEKQYLDRFACYVAGVDYFRAQDGLTRGRQNDDIRSAARMISKLPLIPDDFGSQPVARIRQNIELHDPDLVVIDYLQYLASDLPTTNLNQQVSQISRDLSTLKSDYNIPVVVAAQLNRASEHRQNSEPVLVDLRDSGQIEQDADVVMMIHRPDMNDPDTDPGDERIRILCRKNRMGQLWNVTLRFVDGQQWLTDDHTQKGVMGP